MELEHYLNDTGSTEKALDRVKPRDPGLFRIWRYKTALMLKRFPMHLDALPLESGATPEDLEDCERAVSFFVTSRLKRYDMVRRRYVGGSQACGAWGAEITYDPVRGLGVSARDPRCIRWADGFLEPHEAGNPWVMTLARMPISQIKQRKGWKVPADLQGDSSHLTDAGWSVPAWLPPFGEDGGRAREGGTQKLVTVAKYYCRYEPKSAGSPDTSKALDPEMWHMACPTCGWRSPGQSEAMQEFPPYVAGGCEKCGMDTGRVTRAYEKPADGKYSGKKLIICAPFSGHEEPFYEGDWEFDFPTFPVLWLESYVMPHRPSGQSDTQVLKTPVLGSNALLRLSYETLLRSRPYFAMPADGIENARGARFSFDPDNDGDVMYWTGDIPKLPQIVQGQGVNASMFAAYDRMQSAFRTNESTSEQALTPDQLARAKVGVVEQQTETGNVIVDDHGALLYDAESLFQTCIAQALRELPSENIRYQDLDGQWKFRRFGGPLMPRVEIRVGSGQMLDTLDADELQSYMTLAQMPPEHRRGYARFAHIDPSVIAQVDADTQEAMQRQMMEQQQQMAMGGMVPPGPMGAGGAPTRRQPQQFAMNGGSNG